MTFLNRAIVVLVLMMLTPAAVCGGHVPFGYSSPEDGRVVSFKLGDVDQNLLLGVTLPSDSVISHGGKHRHKAHCHGRTLATVGQSVLWAETARLLAPANDKPIAAHALSLNIPSARPIAKVTAVSRLGSNNRGDAQLAAIATVVLLI